MNVLEHLAQAAAVLLLLELLMILIVFLAISGGLAFGLHWVRGKTPWAFGKVNTYSGLGQKYSHKGTDYLALPVIVTAGAAERVKGTLRSLQEQVRRLRHRGATQPVVAARPVSPPPQEPSSPDVLV